MKAVPPNNTLAGQDRKDLLETDGIRRESPSDVRRDGLLRITEAVAHSRGFEPPVFVDVRFSRPVRAPGFREHTFENSLPAGRYRWIKGLGNEGIGDGGRMRIYKPAEAATLLDLALDERERSRRLIFFCSCASPQLCHRNLVRSLLLAEATNRGIELEVVEWPGGEPHDQVVCTLKLAAAAFSKIVAGAARIPITEDLALGPFAALPWGGYIEISDGDRRATVSVGPAHYSGGRWFLLPFITPVEENDDVNDLAEAVRTVRNEDNYRVFRAESK